MWPRLIAQLLELLPHVSRLIPMADSYFTSRPSGDRAHTAALNTLGETMRSDLATLSESTSDLSARVTRSLVEQNATVTALKSSLDLVEAENLRINRQLEWLGKDVSSLRLWVKFGVSAILILLATIFAFVIKIFLAH